MGLTTSKSIPLATNAAAWLKATEARKRRFTYVDRFDEELLAYQLRDGYIGCPRAAFVVGEKDQRVRGDRIQGPPKNPPEFVPRDGQHEFIQKSLNILAHDESFVGQAPTGWGKTVVACQIIRAVGRKTLVVVTKEDLLDSWTQEIETWLGVKPGLIQGDTCDVRDVTLAMVHTLAQRGLPKEIADQFGFVLWDEVHRMAADTFSTTSFLFPAMLRMGLSATPHRLDGREAMIFDTIGPIRVVHEALQLTPTVALYRSPWQCPRWRCKACSGGGCPACGGEGYREAHHKPGRTTHIEKDVAAHPERNALLLKIIRQAFDRGRRTVVFSSLVDHLKFLKEKATEHMGIPADDTSLYISGLTKKQRGVAATKRVMFATYQMMGEGTNIPWLDTAVLAMPRANVEQAIGRVLREHPDKPNPVVVDIQDQSSSVFDMYCTKRRKLYATMGAPATKFVA
jgi:superfamily II DNA or RNA helicase